MEMPDPQAAVYESRPIMAENNALAQKRQQIKAEIEGGKYKSLAGVIINGMGILADSVLDAIVSEDDLNDLRKWLTDTFNMKGQLLISLVPALVILPFFNFLLIILTALILI